MSFKVADYSFMGTYRIDDIDDIKDWPGLYAVLCRRNNKHFLVDVGETNSLRSEIEESDRRETWEENCSGDLVVAVKYTMEMHQAERARMERKIRKRHNPPCRKNMSLKLE
jgi:hypothetical protein